MAFTAKLSINWSMLRDQKKALLEIMDEADGRLDGLLELIDFIQDCGELAGEPVELLTEDEEGQVMADAPLTVGLLRRVIADLPDDAVIRPAWAHSWTPGDDEPGVVLQGFDVCDGELLALVGLFYLDDPTDSEEDCDAEATDRA